jgi:hypothetical protein
VLVLEGKEIHLVKRVSKELGLTYKELGEAIGYSESNLRKSVSENRLSVPLQKVIELYLENQKVKNLREERERLKDILSTFLSKI